MKSEALWRINHSDSIVSLFSEVLRDCSLDTFEVQKGDIIILSSDGLWDVIQSDQLQQIVERNANKVMFWIVNVFLFDTKFFSRICKT